jgi:ribosomal protein S28E/S33
MGHGMKVELLRIMEKRTATQTRILATVVGPVRMGAVVEILRSRFTAVQNVRNLSKMGAK